MKPALEHQFVCVYYVWATAPAPKRRRRRFVALPGYRGRNKKKWGGRGENLRIIINSIIHNQPIN